MVTVVVAILTCYHSSFSIRSYSRELKREMQFHLQFYSRLSFLLLYVHVVRPLHISSSCLLLVLA